MPVYEPTTWAVAEPVDEGVTAAGDDLEHVLEHEGAGREAQLAVVHLWGDQPQDVTWRPAENEHHADQHNHDGHLTTCPVWIVEGQRLEVIVWRHG